MAQRLPASSEQVESNIKTDVQRNAPDSNPYLKVHWLRSLIAGISYRIFDFYRDLTRSEQRLLPDTADEDTALRWGSIYIGPSNAATGASGSLVATGTAGGAIPVGTVLVGGGIELTATVGATISAQSISVTSITRSGTVATATTASDHKLTSFVPVTISGAAEVEYNVVGAEITVTGPNTFTYEVAGAPASPASGTILAAHVSAVVQVDTTELGASSNLSADTPAKLQSPIVNVDDTMYVAYSGITGGTDAEELPAYIARYLERIRNPVAHFNEADIVGQAKTVAGVTRVFVSPAGTQTGSVNVTSLTRSGQVVTAVCDAPHGAESGAISTIAGANEPEYNVADARILVEDDVTFHYLVLGSPSSPATGTITASTNIPAGQVVTHFTRDNDDSPIPDVDEVQTVADAVNAIRPANMYEGDNFVLAPTAVPVDYLFSALSPNTPTMRAAVAANLQQFHDERAAVSVSVSEDEYRAAIQQTVDPDTGDRVETFTLTAPVGDIPIVFGELATRGDVTFA